MGGFPMTIKWIILVLALLGSVYSIVLEIVKYRSANNPTPDNVSDVYDAETYQTWKKYSAEHCRLNLISAVISGAVTLVLLYTDVYAAFAALFPAGIYWELFAVVLLETAVGTVLGLFQSYISTMVIEQKYGFNRSTMKTFILDRIRGLIAWWLDGRTVCRRCILYYLGDFFSLSRFQPYRQ